MKENDCTFSHGSKYVVICINHKILLQQRHRKEQVNMSLMVNKWNSMCIRFPQSLYAIFDSYSTAVRCFFQYKYCMLLFLILYFLPSFTVFSLSGRFDVGWNRPFDVGWNRWNSFWRNICVLFSMQMSFTNEFQLDIRVVYIYTHIFLNKTLNYFWQKSSWPSKKTGNFLYKLHLDIEIGGWKKIRTEDSVYI